MFGWHGAWRSVTFLKLIDGEPQKFRRSDFNWRHDVIYIFGTFLNLFVKYTSLPLWNSLRYVCWRTTLLFCLGFQTLLICPPKMLWMFYLWNEMWWLSAYGQTIITINLCVKQLIITDVRSALLSSVIFRLEFIVCRCSLPEKGQQSDGSVPSWQETTAHCA